MTRTMDPPSRERVSRLLHQVAGKRIAVIGDVMLDHYLSGDADRISAEAPVPIVVIGTEERFPGGAANAAANVSTAGATPLLAGVTGDDITATALRTTLDAYGIDHAGVIAVAGRVTTSKTRIVSRGQQVARIDREMTNPLADRHRDAFLIEAHRSIAAADALLIEDYDKGAIDAFTAAALVDTARRRKIPIVVDPKHRNFFAYSGATVFKPNRRELADAFHTPFTGEDDDELEDARQRLGADHLLVTLGPAGAVLVSEAAGARQVASTAREVFDVTGAGDTVAAWLAVILAAGGSVDEAAWIANTAGGVKVGKRATGTVSPAEVLEHLRD